MPVADQMMIQRALTQFCEQRAQIEVLGCQIINNVRKITTLYLQSDLLHDQWGQNVVSLDAARMHIEFAHLFSDTARLANLANQLHEDFSAAADDYLCESYRRRATLVAWRIDRGAPLPEDLLSRVDAAMTRCDNEITQIHELIERSGSAVSLLVAAARQVLGLRL